MKSERVAPPTLTARGGCVQAKGTVNHWLRRRLGGIRAKKCARWSLGVLTVTAVALTAVMGGQRYLYCRAMDQIMTQTTCECAGATADAEGQGSPGIFADCFEVRFLEHLVSFTVGADFAVPAAPLLAVLPVPGPALTPAGVLLGDADHPIRAGPFSPTASRAQLMVFLT
jgi:hypothetical protein